MLDLSIPERLDGVALLPLLQRTDPIGVVSIYVDLEPDGRRREPRAAAIDIWNRLTELERRLDAEPAPERALAVGAALRRWSHAIEELVDPRESGRGRALYIPLSGGRPARFTSRLALPNRVVLDASPFVHPLLELIDEGRPTGVLLVSRGEANILDWRLGELRSLGRVAPRESEAPHERSGPVGNSPRPSRSSPMQEQREARRRSQTQTLLAETAAETTRLAEEHGWERLLVSGGRRLTEPLVRALTPHLRSVAIRDPRALGGLDRPELEAEITERLLAENRERERALIRSMREGPHSAVPSALGLSEVLAALNEGRVAHLAYDPGVRYEGSVDERGLLHPDGESPPASGELAHERRLTERIVERCLTTGARISPVEGASQDGLSDAGGIGALLRW